MRKWMGCLLAAMMIFGSAAAESIQRGPLTLEELDDWGATLYELAQGEDPELSEDEDGPAYVYSFGTLYFDGDTLTSAVLTDMGAEDLRGIQVGMPAAYAVDAYGSENEELYGTRDAAVAYLYLSDDEPLNGSAGLVSRDGQRIQTIQHMVFAETDAGFRSAGVLYTVEEDLVAAIRLYGLNELRTADEIDEQIAALLAVSASTDYAQVLSSYTGDDLTMFGTADLTFAGCELSELTPEKAADTLGTILEDIWLEDGEGYIRMVQFADCELTMVYDADRQNGRLMTIEALTDSFEGPRAVRLGDSLTSVLTRFRHGDGELNGLSEVFYGTVGQAPYGAADYAADGSATLRYAASLDDGRTAVLMVRFEQVTAREILIYVEE